MTTTKELASEWFDADEYASADIASLPEPNEDYAYAAYHLFSWWPYVNSRGATYEREDFDTELLETLKGVQVNLLHQKTKTVVGSVIDYQIDDQGVDIIVRIDREQASAHGLDLSEMHAGNYFSHCSLELTKEAASSFFYAYDDQFNIRKKLPVLTGRQMGVRRTTARDDYHLQGWKVAERIKPARFTGVGIVPNPADKTAEVFRVTQSDGTIDEEGVRVDELFIELLPEHIAAIEAGELTEQAAAAKKALTPGGNYADPGFKGVKKYPLDTPEHTKAAARFWGIASYRDGYTPAQQAHISAKIAAAKEHHGIGDDETAANEGATAHVSDLDLATLQAKVLTLEAEVTSLRAEKEAASAESSTKLAELEAEVTRLNTELASANEKVTKFEAEKAEAEHAAAIDALMDELHAIHPISDEERPELREKAAAACGNDGVVRELKFVQRDRAYEARQKVLEEREAALKLKEDPAAAKAAAEAEAAAAKAAAEAEAAAKAEAAQAAAAAAAEAEAAAKAAAEHASEFEPGSDDRSKLTPPVTVKVNGKDVTYIPGQLI